MEVGGQETERRCDPAGEERKEDCEGTDLWVPLKACLTDIKQLCIISFCVHCTKYKIEMFLPKCFPFLIVSYFLRNEKKTLFLLALGAVLDKQEAR